jgi:hypothetical protein
MYTLRFAIALGIATIAAQAADPLLGTWKLNVEKSGDNLGINPPKSSIRTYSAGPNDTIQLTINTVPVKGEPTSSSTTIIYGKEREASEATRNSPVMKAFGGATHVQSKRVSDRRSETKYLRDGKTVATAVSEISADGKTMTSVTTGTTPDGRQGKVAAVYEKQ